MTGFVEEILQKTEALPSGPGMVLDFQELDYLAISSITIPESKGLCKHNDSFHGLFHSLLH